jgi:hypothetical protein
MNVDAYLCSGRCVASAYQKLIVGRTLRTTWHDTRETGGVYQRLEGWIRVVVLEHSTELVSFRMRKQQ